MPREKLAFSRPFLVEERRLSELFQTKCDDSMFACVAAAL